MNETYRKTLAIIGNVFLMFLSLLLNGWMIMNLWSWFLVNPFNLGSIGLVESIGLYLIILFCIIAGYRHDVSKKENYKIDSIKLASVSFISKGLLFVMAYIVSRFL